MTGVLSTSGVHWPWCCFITPCSFLYIPSWSLLYDSAVFHRLLQTDYLQVFFGKGQGINKQARSLSFPTHTHTQKAQFDSRLSSCENLLAGFPASAFSSHDAGFLFLNIVLITLPSCSRSRLLGKITAVDVVFRLAFRALHHVPTHFQFSLSCSLTGTSAPGHSKWCHPRLTTRNPASPTPATTLCITFGKPSKLQLSEKRMSICV